MFYKIRVLSVQFLGSCVTPSPAQQILPQCFKCCGFLKSTGRILLMASHLGLTATSRWEEGTRLLSSRIIKVVRCRPGAALVSAQPPATWAWGTHLTSPYLKCKMEANHLQNRKMLKKEETHRFWELCSKRNFTYRSCQKRMLPILTPSFFSWSHQTTNRKKQNQVSLLSQSFSQFLQRMWIFSGASKNLDPKVL